MVRLALFKCVDLQIFKLRLFWVFLFFSYLEKEWTTIQFVKFLEMLNNFWLLARFHLRLQQKLR